MLTYKNILESVLITCFDVVLFHYFLLLRLYDSSLYRYVVLGIAFQIMFNGCNYFFYFLTVYLHL